MPRVPPHAATRSKTRLPLSRRQFMQSTAAASSPFVLLKESHAAGTSLEGYTASPSVVQGGSIVFYLRDPQALGTGTTVYPLTITRIAQPDAYVTSTQVSIGNQTVPADASTQGCRWAPSYTLSVPATWPSGLYYAYIGSGANACTVPFVVRAATATAGVKTLVMIPVTTVHAYNAYGGKSIYDFNSSGGVRASQVSLDRPFTEAFNSFFDTWSQYLVRWLAKNNLSADFCTDIDIEANPAILAPYQLYMQAGHDEYWSLGRRNALDAFVARGGNAAFLGGNTMWFQARLASNAAGVPRRTLVCYKDAAADPMTDPALKTINWINLATPRPENISTGLGFLYGCSWVEVTPPRPDTPQVVMRPEHWAFAGTSLAQGAGFGGAYVGYECDSALFALGADQKPYPTGADGTPATLRILAQADGSNWNALSLAARGTGEQSGYSQVAVFSNGGTAGTVFNSGSNDWAYGLRPELDGQPATPISRITLNIVNKLSQPWTETADVRQFRKVVSGALLNTYYTTGTTAPSGSGLLLDGWAFRAFPQPVAGSVPVYRYRSTTPGSTGTRYRYSRSNALDTGGVFWVLEAVAFHGYAAARSDATAIFEHYVLNTALLEFSVYYSATPTPPAGYTAGPVVWYAPTDNTVVVSPGFQLSASASSVSVAQGRAVSSTISITPINGFSGAVSFATTALPAGVTAAFTPASSTTATTLVLTVSAAVAPGSYTVTIQGTGAGVAATATVSVALLVTAAPLASFSLSASPSTVRLPFSALIGGSTGISVLPVNGFSGAVSFGISGLPAGLVANFSPASSGSGTTLGISRAPFAVVLPGNYPVTVRGVSGALGASVQVTLSVVLLL